MGLERELIKRYVISYIVCVVLTLSAEYVIPVLSLSLEYHLYLAASLSLAWRGMAVSTSGLERALGQTGWSIWRAFRPLWLCATFICVTTSIVMVWVTPHHHQTFMLSLRPHPQIKICLETSGEDSCCTSAPWRSARRFLRALPPHGALTMKGPPHTEIIVSHHERSRQDDTPMSSQTDQSVLVASSRTSHQALITMTCSRLLWLAMIMIWLSLGWIPRVSLMVIINLSVALELTLRSIYTG